MAKKFKHLKIWVQSALPLVFDDSLSYYECIAKLISYVNVIIKDMQTISNKIEELENRIEGLENNGG